MKKIKILAVFVLFFASILVITGCGEKEHSYTLTLLGDTEMTLELGNPYVEPGYELVDESGNKSSKLVKIDGTVNENEVGIYRLIYYVDEGQLLGTRTVNVVEAE